jgi:hypothetical protein
MSDFGTTTLKIHYFAGRWPQKPQVALIHSRIKSTNPAASSGVRLFLIKNCTQGFNTFLTALKLPRASGFLGIKPLWHE